MIIEVRLFAGARQAAESELVAVSLPNSATVADLRQALIAQFPALVPWESRLLIAVDQQYAGEQQSLSPDDEVACFPPVSGG